MFVDSPCKLIVQLPGDEGKDDGGYSHEDGQGDEHGLDLGPEIIRDEVVLVQGLDRIPDLILLDGGIDENANVVDDESDDLNGVFHAQSIVYEYQLVDVSEHEYGEISGDGAGFIMDIVDVLCEAALESAEYITRRQRRVSKGLGWDEVGTYASRPRATTTWTRVVSRKAQVHFVDGMYILGVRRTGGGSWVGKPSRWWYPPGCESYGWGW